MIPTMYLHSTRTGLISARALNPSLDSKSAQLISSWANLENLKYPSPR